VDCGGGRSPDGEARHGEGRGGSAMRGGVKGCEVEWAMREEAGSGLRGRVIWIWVEAACLSKAGKFVGSWDVDLSWLSKAGQFVCTGKLNSNC
jgi:hypothetical protein